MVIHAQAMDNAPTCGRVKPLLILCDNFMVA